jgi:glucokinase
VIDSEGEIHASLRDATPHTERETEDILVNLITKLAGTQPISAVGLAVAGFVSQDRRRVMFAPHLAWRDADVPERISARVQLPVVMDHDVNSAAWAEFARGASAGSQISLLVALGTGIGAGLIIDGEIYRGAHGVAPELGHLTVVPGGRPCACGKRGCWERYCSGTALAETARELMAGGDAPILRQLSGADPAALTGTMVAIAATEGDPVALAAMDELGRWLAQGLALVTDVLDPEVIVVGGGVASAAGMFLPLAVSEFAGLITGAGHRPVPRVELARFGDRAGIIGAALLAAAR